MSLRIIFAVALLCVLTVNVARAEKPIPPGLAKVMAEGAGRVVNPTCDDVRAVVAWIGEARAAAMAREAGATEARIKEAKRCLRPSSQ